MEPSSDEKRKAGGKEANPPPFYPWSGNVKDREEVSEILDGQLFLTNWRSAQSEEKCRLSAITHIVSVGEEFKEETPLSKPLGIKYLQLNVTDDEEQALVMKKRLGVGIEFITNALKSSKDARVLVHCAAGISRSTTVVLSFLMKHKRWTLRKSFEHTYKKRRVVWPNNGFMKLLIEYEKSVFGTSHIPKANMFKKEVPLKKQIPAVSKTASRGRASRGTRTLVYPGSRPRSRSPASRAKEKPSYKFTNTMSLKEYKKWGEFDIEQYQAARVVDRS
mmetsp:Transcript_33773/g.54370  ORF Transcript_33773/g.54370 Transcript_33773/m.54370 type:complete len:276 (-) Transcript_33773:242-1069(-)